MPKKKPAPTEGTQPAEGTQPSKEGEGEKPAGEGAEAVEEGEKPDGEGEEAVEEGELPSQLMTVDAEAVEGKEPIAPEVRSQSPDCFTFHI